MSVCCAVHHHRCSSSVRDLMKYRFATCTIPPMKQRNFRRWIAVAVLGAHVFVPFAAYASVKAGTVFGDVCSVFGKAQAPTATPVGLPAQGSDRHTADHCALCPGGSATAAIMPPALPTMPAHAHPIVARRSDCAAPTSLQLLLPPARAPPTAA
jgi:DUF2946 family protein